MKRTKYTLCAFLAAALYALNAPISKLLLSDSEPKMTAALLYLGAGLGAARTGACYAIAPFVGALLSFVMLGESLSLSFAAGLVIMIFCAYLSVTDSRS